MAEGQSDLGIKADGTRITVEIVRNLKNAAEQGHADAQYNLALVFKQEFCVEKSDEGAVKWLRKAAEQGFNIAQFVIGKTYEKGWCGVKQNYVEAAM